MKFLVSVKTKVFLSYQSKWYMHFFFFAHTVCDTYNCDYLHTPHFKKSEIFNDEFYFKIFLKTTTFLDIYFFGHKNTVFSDFPFCTQFPLFSMFSVSRKTSHSSISHWFKPWVIHLYQFMTCLRFCTVITLMSWPDNRHNLTCTLSVNWSGMGSVIVDS